MPRCRLRHAAAAAAAAAVPAARADLTVRDGVRIGHRARLHTAEGEVEVVTRSLRPLVFEVPGFLSDEECDWMRRRAEEQGITQSERECSRVQRPPDEADAVSPDDDGDGMLNVTELRQTMVRHHRGFLNNQDIVAMLADPDVAAAVGDPDGDGRVPYAAVGKPSGFAALRAYVLKHPELRERMSAHTFVKRPAGDPGAAAVAERAALLTGLPTYRFLHPLAELQVVLYRTGDHYHIHHDSAPPDSRLCCHISYLAGTGDKVSCRACRFLTLLLYLNDVPEGAGGHTAFPAARGEGDRHLGDSKEDVDRFIFSSDDYHNSKYCSENSSGLRIRPEKGKAVLFYSYQLNEEGWRRTHPDYYATHSACPVGEGVQKWSANFWSLVSDSESQDDLVLGAAGAATDYVPPGTDEEVEAEAERDAADGYESIML